MFTRDLSTVATAAMAACAVLVFAYALSLVRPSPPAPPAKAPVGNVALAGPPAMIKSVEGGVQTGGYIDGRPVPSGFAMPVVIRYSNASEPTKIGKPAPVEAAIAP